jgi:hypothetical protein
MWGANTMIRCKGKVMRFIDGKLTQCTLLHDHKARGITKHSFVQRLNTGKVIRFQVETIVGFDELILQTMRLSNNEN